MKHIDAIISRCKKHDKVKVRSGAPAVMDSLIIGVLSSMLIADVDNMVLFEHPLLQTTNF